MSKKSTPASSHVRALNSQFANPQAIIEQIEAKSTGVAPDDSYRARIEEVMDLLLPKQGDIDLLDDAEHIRETRAGIALETAARHTGFILGFEYCRDLICPAPPRQAVTR
jgi:hypothetical protein